MDNYECDGQLSLFDVAIDCRNCEKFKTDCSQETPTIGWCERYKAQPKWMRVDRCQNCSRWVYTGEQTKPRGWGVFGVCLEHDQQTDGCGYCNCFEGMGDANYWRGT